MIPCFSALRLPTLLPVPRPGTRAAATEWGLPLALLSMSTKTVTARTVQRAGGAANAPNLIGVRSRNAEFRPTQLLTTQTRSIATTFLPDSICTLPLRCDCAASRKDAAHPRAPAPAVPCGQRRAGAVQCHRGWSAPATRGLRLRKRKHRPHAGPTPVDTDARR